MLFIQNLTYTWSKNERCSACAAIRSRFPQARLCIPPGSTALNPLRGGRTHQRKSAVCAELFNPSKKGRKIMVNWNLFQTLYGAEELQGCTNEDIAYLEQEFGHLPEVLKDFYLAAARTEAFHQVQDLWMLPEHFRRWDWLRDSNYLILLDENQGVCQAGIRCSDLEQPDPPVYVSMDRKEWELCAPTTSEFLKAALSYEAAFACEFSQEDFYFLTEEDFEVLQSRLKQQPYELHKWIGDINISIYSNAEDNVAVLMIVGEETGERDIQMLYGASTKEGYEKILAALEDVGEPG